MSRPQDIEAEYARLLEKNLNRFLEVATGPSVNPSDIKPTGRLRTIFSALATGWLPWGIEWKPTMSLHKEGFILCCDHTLSPAYAGKLAAAGLLELTTDDHTAVKITEQGRKWLAENWIS
ncbi:hypothetical protein [Roseibium alexandrii]|uniref:hypothetical protein n=1 Tax=Roseibium alexandrii TaxID=388408 RepID=UPI0037513C43